MTRTRYRIFETEYPYFMTCTINAWLQIFTRPESAEVIFNSWRHLQRERDFKLFGYVILKNHLHLIASAPELSNVMRSFFTRSQAPAWERTSAKLRFVRTAIHIQSVTTSIKPGCRA